MARLFTLDEANALLPRLRQILSRLQASVQELETAGEAVAVAERKIRSNGRGAASEPYAAVARIRTSIDDLVREVQEIGCELKDPRTGLIDFPSQRAGEVVFLCWKLDEQRISYWHPLDTGFAGRQPL